MDKEFKFINVATCTPNVEIGYPKGNLENIKNLLTKHIKESDVFVFPELCVTGYSCEDLFYQKTLVEAALYDMYRFINTNQRLLAEKLVILGLPIYKDNKLFNCAVYIYRGEVVGFVPKTYLGPNEETRWFANATERLSDTITIMGKSYAFTPNLIFVDNRLGLNAGIVLGNDVAYPMSMGSQLSVNGVNFIFNPTAQSKTVYSQIAHKDLIMNETKKNICGYASVSATIDESTTNEVFSGQKIIAANGRVFRNKQYDEKICVATIDVEEINHFRSKQSFFLNNNLDCKFIYVDMPFANNSKPEVNPYPFIPSDKNKEQVINEIFDIQVIALAQRMKKTGINNLVLGVSGGLDSTLALLVAVEALKRNKLPLSNLIGITMPGFGTSNRTLSNSVQLMDLFGITQKEISIVPACLQHFEDIEHDKENFDATYENVQARERTQILMDMANKENALVVGTGDLSELVLGWCTYNGDHMSMYAVNAGIPKTLIKHIVLEKANAFVYKAETRDIAKVLEDICYTLVSPELLPTDKDGNMVQTTEGTIGKYDLHDFFLYHMFRNGFSPKKIYFLATNAFPDIDREVIKNTLNIFYKRFITQQFKRSCLPDGPKIGSIGISPRGDLKMPSDACARLWLDEIENI